MTFKQEASEQNNADARRWRAVRDELAWASYGGGWRIVGNDFDGHSMPYPNSIDAAADRLATEQEAHNDNSSN